MAKKIGVMILRQKHKTTTLIPEINLTGLAGRKKRTPFVKIVQRNSRSGRTVAEIHIPLFALKAFIDESRGLFNTISYLERKIRQKEKIAENVSEIYNRPSSEIINIKIPESEIENVEV